MLLLQQFWSCSISTGKEVPALPCAFLSSWVCPSISLEMFELSHENRYFLNFQLPFLLDLWEEGVFAKSKKQFCTRGLNINSFSHGRWIWIRFRQSSVFLPLFSYNIHPQERFCPVHQREATGRQPQELTSPNPFPETQCMDMYGIFT